MSQVWLERFLHSSKYNWALKDVKEVLLTRNFSVAVQ